LANVALAVSTNDGSEMNLERNTHVRCVASVDESLASRCRASSVDVTLLSAEEEAAAAGESDVMNVFTASCASEREYGGCSATRTDVCCNTMSAGEGPRDSSGR
jgi:hypothetical protein